MACCILQSKDLPKPLWFEALNTVICILNRSPIKEVFNKTSYEVWFKRKLKVDHFRVFGCIASSHIPTENREELDGKGEKYIFIRYSDESKSYCLYNPKTKKLIISKDVIFDEASKWSWPSDLAQQSCQEDFQIQEIREERSLAEGSSSLIRPSSSESSSSSPTSVASP